MPLIGYARISTEDQTADPQERELRAAGCAEIHREQGSGGNRARPVLARLMERIGKGDVLVVVRIDRLARSLSHLLELLDRLEAKGAHFRSLNDPIDTSSPQGKFTLQVLGAAAEFERALIRERTRAGLQSARAQGRIGGNPGLRAGDPRAIRKVVQGAARQLPLTGLNETSADWVPLVRRHRPDMPWEDLVRLINARLPQGHQAWTLPRLRRAVDAYVREGMLPESLLAPAPRAGGTGPPARAGRRAEGGGPGHDAATDLRPTGIDARTHAARADEMAALIRADAAGTRRKARSALAPFILPHIPRGVNWPARPRWGLAPLCPLFPREQRRIVS